jgi:hypothetical protein
VVGLAGALAIREGNTGQSLGRRFAVQIALLVIGYAVAFACVPEGSRNGLIVPLVAAGLFLILCVRRRLRKERRQAGSPPIK